MPFGHAALTDWPLDPDIIYLNHGTVGVTPLRVLAAQQTIRDEVERAPSQFLLRAQFPFAGRPTGRPTRVRQAADAVAPHFGARGQDLVFVDNATTGVNAVLRSIQFQAGDEILLTSHNYGATLRAAQFVARERGASVRVADVPYPEFSAGALVESIGRSLTPRTRVAVLDHVTSESALVFPLAELAALCRDRHVLVLVDAAHAPGMLPIDLSSLGVDWYTANLHKWACSPRSCGFLWAGPDRQADLHPPVISWGLDQGFTAEFDWVGTRDASAWLAAPDGLAFLQDLGIDGVWRHNHGLAWQGAQLLAQRWGTTLGFRESDIGFMATVPMLPGAGSTPEDAARVRDQLLFDHHIEVQVHAAHGRIWARISAQVYNEISDVERLAEAVLEIAGRPAQRI
jgi:isopenicillin-N epimerase